MSKYIDTDKLIERLEEMKRAEYENCGGVNAKTKILQEVQGLIASLQQEQPETDLLEEAYMRGSAQGAKEERESLSHTMLTYAADVFSGKMLIEDISYSYRQELADYFRDLTKTAQEE